MVTKNRISLEEFNALPDDGIRRWVIDGILHEGEDMSQRNRQHCKTMTKIARYLDEWAETQPKPRGHVLVGDAGIILEHDPFLSFGVDAAYVTAELWSRQDDETTTMILGVPQLVVEILSPSTRLEDINEKIDAFLDHSVPLIWVLDPYWKVVDVYQPGHKKKMLDADQTLNGGQVLPGFSVAVAMLFEE